MLAEHVVPYAYAEAIAIERAIQVMQVGLADELALATPWAEGTLATPDTYFRNRSSMDEVLRDAVMVAGCAFSASVPSLKIETGVGVERQGKITWRLSIELAFRSPEERGFVGRTLLGEDRTQTIGEWMEDTARLYRAAIVAAMLRRGRGRAGILVLDPVGPRPEQNAFKSAGVARARADFNVMQQVSMPMNTQPT